MSRVLRRLSLVAAAALIAWPSATPVPVGAAAADPRWDHRIVSGFVPEVRRYGFDLEERMNALGAQGYRLATVVQPRPPLLAEEVTVILARPLGEPVNPAQFVILTAETAADLQTRVAGRTGDGFGVTALTVTQNYLRPTTRRGDAIRFYDLGEHPALYVAILEKAPGAVPRPARVVEATTEKGGWDGFVAATRASFRVTQALWLGPLSVTRERERILFLLHDDGTGSAYETAVPATTPRTNLNDHIERQRRRGFEVEALWTMLDRAELLFIRPVGRRAAPPEGHRATTWNLDETLDVTGDGRLVGGAYARDEGALVRHFVQDRRLAGYRYDGVTGVFPRSIDDRGQLGGVGFVGFGPPPETEQTCAACLALNERGAEGYRAVWAAVGPGYKFDRRMEVVLEAYRP